MWALQAVAQVILRPTPERVVFVNFQVCARTSSRMWSTLITHTYALITHTYARDIHIRMHGIYMHTWDRNDTHVNERAGRLEQATQVLHARP